MVNCAHWNLQTKTVNYGRRDTWATENQARSHKHKVKDSDAVIQIPTTPQRD